MRVPQKFSQFNCDRARLEHALLQSGSSGYWVVNAATEQVIRAHGPRLGVILYHNQPHVLEFAAGYPAYEFAMPNSMGRGLVRPWCPPGLTKAGGWIAEFARHQFPFNMTLGRDDDKVYGRVCVFPDAELAIMAAMLHGLDGTKSDLKVGDGLGWSLGEAVPCPV